MDNTAIVLAMAFVVILVSTIGLWLLAMRIMD